MTDKQKLEILERHVAELAEIYDAVQILASNLEPDGSTHGQKRGSGNWYARQGMAQEFIQEDIANEHATMIARKLDPPDED